MTKQIDYYLTPTSPWTYLGHERFAQIAKRFGAAIAVKPVDYGVIFPQSGGLPLAKRAPQRQAYRLSELARWREFLGVLWHRLVGGQRPRMGDCVGGRGPEDGPTAPPEGANVGYSRTGESWNSSSRAAGARPLRSRRRSWTRRATWSSGRGSLSWAR